MDLGGECSVFEESVEDNQVIKSPSAKFTNGVETEIENNGNCAVDGTTETNNQALEGFNSPNLVSVKSSSPSPSPRTTKGKGLKKWRRIKREVTTEGGSNLDSGKLLKRGLSNSVVNSDRQMQFPADIKQNSEGSVSSTNAAVRNLGPMVDYFRAVGDSGLGMSPSLAAGMESEYSEDCSSRSSTAASAPKMTYEMPITAGFTRDKNGTCSLSGKSVGSYVQNGHRGKVQTETSKKLRGQLVKIETENSHSSMESDSRSSNFVFVQDNNIKTSNGRRGKSSNYDGENSDEVQGSEQQLNEELQTRSTRKYGGEFEVTSKEKSVADSTWGFKDVKIEYNGPSSDGDSMLESVITLQSLQEELEKELQKFREIGKEDLCDDSVFDDSNQQLQCSDLVEEPFDNLETEMASLKETLNLLESKLDDSTVLLKVKESKIAELEGILNGKLMRGETGRTIELYRENYRDMEIELEGLFRQKIEAEVEYLAISRTIQKFRVAVVDQITILEEQKSNQARIMSNLEDTEAKAAILKGLSEKLENYGANIVIADETLKLKSGVCKHVSCFFLQLILLVFILAVFLGQLHPPHDMRSVPT